MGVAVADCEVEIDGVPVVEPETDLLTETDLLNVTLTVPVRDVVVVAE